MDHTRPEHLQRASSTLQSCAAHIIATSQSCELLESIKCENYNKENNATNLDGGYAVKCNYAPYISPICGVNDM